MWNHKQKVEAVKGAVTSAVIVGLFTGNVVRVVRIGGVVVIATMYTRRITDAVEALHELAWWGVELVLHHHTARHMRKDYRLVSLANEAHELGLGVRDV